VPAPESQPRNLQEGWCPRGNPLSVELRRRDPGAQKRITAAFAHTPVEERAAARLLHAFTGLEPRLEDRQAGAGSRDGATDILLTSSSGRHQVVEVTQSLDPHYERAADAVARLEAAIADHYAGRVSWMLELERGWEATTWRTLAPAIAAALATAPAPSSSDQPVTIHPHIRAHAIGPTDPPVVWITGRNAGASSFGMPYLDALSSYLEQDITVRGKLDKLTREALLFDAQRVHLFIAMASTGARGGLLPTSPSYFTWGTFVPPEPLTDLWLDGRTGELYHWTVEAGWVFHELDVDEPAT